MAVLVTDPNLEERLIAERQASGGDRFDEVWGGTYVMAPLADDEHQDVQARLTTVLQTVVGWDETGLVRAGVNVSDRDEGWEHNYRCPDVVVFKPGGTARNCDTHWVGGPDFAVEIRSRGDRSREKLEFYASVNVRELLIVERHPWSIELFRLRAGRLQSAGHLQPDDAGAVESEVIPLSFRIVSGARRPVIEVSRRDGAQRWLV